MNRSCEPEKKCHCSYFTLASEALVSRLEIESGTDSEITILRENGKGLVIYQLDISTNPTASKATNKLFACRKIRSSSKVSIAY